MMDGPRIFDISPPGLGAERLARWMRHNGIKTCCFERGTLAEDIVWGAVAKQPPCPNRPHVRFYAGLGNTGRFGAPPALGWRRFRYLRKVFRQAIFLLVIRDPDEWVADRLAHQAGNTARVEAITRQVLLQDLPALWRDEYAAHIADARHFFRDDPRYVELDHDRLGFAQLRDALAPWYRLTQVPPTAPLPRPDPQSEAAQNARLPFPQLAPPPGRIRPPLRGEDAAFANRMAEFCLGETAPAPDMSDRMQVLSGLYAHYDGADRAARRNGGDWPLRRNRDLPLHPFIIRPGMPKSDRMVGVLNDLVRLGRAQPVHIDMQDSRRFGTRPDNITMPVLAYNRRGGARNVVLWPLPGYHTLGAPQFAHPRSPDPIPWDAKTDNAAWRGDLSGQSRLPDGGFGRSPHNLFGAIDDLAPDDDAGLQDILHQLHRVPRMAAIRNLHEPDFDMGLTLSRFMAEFEIMPMLIPYLDRRRSREWFYGFRYLLSLPGYDTGSNFIMAANSGSVVMKAEDGWELFYSHLFRPWQHYIPLQVDASDAPEKLDWARSHPHECRKMVAAANAACAKLADARLRAAGMHLVLDGLEAGQ